MVFTRKRKPPVVARTYLMHTSDLEPNHALLELFKDYGDIIKTPFPFRHYLINHPKYVQHVYQQNADNYLKTGRNYIQVEKTLGQGLIRSEGPMWHARKRFYSHFFQSKNFQTFWDKVLTTIDQTINQWRMTVSSHDPINLYHEMLTLGLHIITDTFFSYELSDKQTQGIIKHFLNQNRYSAKATSSWPFTPTSSFMRYCFAKRFFNRLQQQFIDEHPADANDFLSVLLNAKHEGLLDDKVLFDEIKTFLITGHVTTGTAMAWSWYLLGTHPDQYQHMLNEIDTVLDGKTPTFDDLQKLEYTGQVFDETIRLYPPLWMNIRQAAEKDQIDGFEIPKKAYVHYYTICLHKHPEFWQAPDDFNPDRFNKTNRPNINRYCYMPFGIGGHTCLGNHLAGLIAKTVLARISQSYRIEIIPNQDLELEYLLSAKPRHGIWAYLHAR